MKADYQMSGGWGNALHFFPTEQNWEEMNVIGKIYTVTGHKRRIPKPRDTVIAEFSKSWMKFVFVSVERPGNPADLFFGAVVAISQEMK